MPVPDPTPIYRLLHVDNLAVVLQRGGLNAPNHTPNDALGYKTIHDVSVQHGRSNQAVDCGPGGVVHDYVPFYFGFLSPMLLKLKTGQVKGYTEGQTPLVYLATTAQTVAQSGTKFTFSDGHGLAAFTSWFADLSQLDQVDWSMVYQRYWADDLEDMDRQRRKQAEFLVHQFCDWSLIEEIGVINTDMKQKVDDMLSGFDAQLDKPVNVHRAWYY